MLREKHNLNQKNKTDESKSMCDYIAIQCSLGTPTEEAMEAFHRKPFYMNYNGKTFNK